MLVFSSSIITLVFSRPLKSCRTTGRASHSHNSNSKNPSELLSPSVSLFFAAFLLKPSTDLLVFLGKPHPCGMVPHVAQLTAKSFLPHRMKSFPSSSEVQIICLLQSCWWQCRITQHLPKNKSPWDPTRSWVRAFLADTYFLDFPASLIPVSFKISCLWISAWNNTRSDSLQQFEPCNHL